MTLTNASYWKSQASTQNHRQSQPQKIAKFTRNGSENTCYPAVDTDASVDRSGAGASARLGNTPLVKLVLSAVTLLMEIPAKVAL